MAATFDRHPFLLPVEDVAHQLHTDVERGLSALQVQQLAAEYPPNELAIGGATPWYKIFLRQLVNPMIVVLAVAMAVSFGINDYIEGGVLAAVILLNVSIGFVQEHKAEKKMDALRALSAPSAMVIRDGRSQVIPNAGVVPGDIVILKMGDTVPADMRLFEAMNLTCDEQTMTGESLPVEKVVHNNIVDPETGQPATTEENVKDGDRVNLAFASTVVRRGRGRGIVIATGMATAVGKIAAASSKKRGRKPGRSMNAAKYGLRRAGAGAFRRFADICGRFLGLTEGTPLQRKLALLAYCLFGCAILLALIVFGVHKFNIPNEVVLYCVSTGIAIIPESLVAVLTITMVQATRVMRKANVVVRDLSALEALGGVTNICSDKTGTLTQGAMVVKNAWLPVSKILTVRDTMDPNDPIVGRVFVSNVQPPQSPSPSPRATSAAPTLQFNAPEEKLNNTREKGAEEKLFTELTPDLRMFLLPAALCNVARVRQDPDTLKWQATGDPTEIALQVFARRFQVGKKVLERKGWKQLAEFPFDSTIKRMSVIYDAPEFQEGDDDADAMMGTNNSWVFTKGAVERIVELCSSAGVHEAEQPMTDELKAKILDQMNEFASLGQRVLAVAYKPWHGRFQKPEPVKLEAARVDIVEEGNGANDAQQKGGKCGAQDDESLRGEVEQGLTFLGLIGIYDPPRIETTGSIQECASAGIRVHMLTGDHPATARAIAQEIGIIPRNLGVLPPALAASVVQQATDFDRLTDAELDALEELPLVVARCAPDTKTRMIEALRRRGAYMAMTGDGVNDAPSLSRADVGIAMGSGSDVAKSAAKIVLTDDQFGSIVAAIREGRRMFDNIQKFILHLLSSNVGEVILLMGGIAFKDSDGFSVFPISPLQILWINMLTSSFPAFGLGREKAGRDIMRKPPHGRGVFTWQIVADMAVYGLVMGMCALLTFVVIVYGRYGGQLGHDCNRGWSEACEPVFRARAAIFVLLTWLILLAAWEFKDIRRSLLRLSPHDDAGRGFVAGFCADIYENKFLFWSVVLGMVSAAPTPYIPALNKDFFKHAPITWEWVIVLAGCVVFLLSVEAWKFLKRANGWFGNAAVSRGPFSQGGGSGGEASGRPFKRTLSMSSFKSWASGASKGRPTTEASA